MKAHAPRPAPRLALGTVQFGLAYGVAGNAAPMSASDARAVLAAASEAGITRLDTAAAYGDIEERLARLVGDLPFSVVSKVPALPAGMPTAEAVAFVRAAIARSDDRLGGLLSGILFHDGAVLAGPDGAVLWAAAGEACERLGIACGFSGYDPLAAADNSLAPAPAMLQLPGNAFDQRLANALPRLGASEVTIRSVFLQGLLLMPLDQAAARVPAAAAALGAWQAWCAQAGLGPLAAALAVGKHLAPDYCVVGVDNVAQLDQIAAAWDTAEPLPAPTLATTDSAVIDPRVWPRKDAQ